MYSDTEGEKKPKQQPHNPFLSSQNWKHFNSLSVTQLSTPENNYEKPNSKHCPVLERILDAQAEKSGSHNVAHNLLIQNAQQHKLLETWTSEIYPRNPAAFP